MDNGFYWYKGSGQEPFDPDEGWIIIKIDNWHGDTIALFTGNEITKYMETELKGRFIGPISPPED